MYDMDLHRELDAREIMLGIIAGWPFEAQIDFLLEELLRTNRRAREPKNSS